MAPDLIPAPDATGPCELCGLEPWAEFIEFQEGDERRRAWACGDCVALILEDESHDPLCGLEGVPCPRCAGPDPDEELEQ